VGWFPKIGINGAIMKNYNNSTRFSYPVWTRKDGDPMLFLDEVNNTLPGVKEAINAIYKTMQVIKIAK
jgi:hypothetical protein